MENIKKTVLMVHNFYQIGGGEHTVFNNEVELLRKNGHKVITYTRDNKELKISMIKKVLLPFSTIWSFKTYRDIKKIIKKENIDIVHCHNTFPLISPSVYYAAKKMNVPVVQTIHNFRLICPNGLLYRDNKICEDCIKNKNFKSALKNNCYRKSKIQTLVVVNMLKFHRLIGTYNKINYIFLTLFNKDKFKTLVNINGDNIFVKPNFVVQNNNYKRGKIKDIFVFAARLDDSKGIKFLINVWNEIEDFELHIYGDGPYREYVENAVKGNKNIKFYGFKSQKEIFMDLIKSQGLLMTSQCYEGFPMNIAETLSLGVPVLSSNIGNQSDIIKKSKAGCLYIINDKNSFKKQLNNIVKNNKEYSDNALKYYNEYLSEKKNYEVLMNIYEKAKNIN